ncbi:MAG: hypothetical protein DMF93_13495 [Acidobacteria bacterium]|nr:MAG: hypothetical protein DMF93_13495 [Acidobacteriota bacterium]
MDTETAEAIDRVGQRVDTLEMSLRGDNQRHATMQFESLGHDIRIIAEGVANLAVKVDRLR